MWQYVLLIVLDLSLYAWVPALQGTYSAPRAHLGRGNELVSGVTISPPHASILNFYHGS
jgi:hypothetical protein